MRNEQEYNNRNDRDRYNEERRNQRNPQHNQDAANRWGQPDPRMGPHGVWNRHEEDPSQPNRSDWKPFEQRENRHFQDDERRYGNYENEGRNWQQDQRNRPGQHPEDRWSSEREMEHPHQQHHHPRHASERFYREQRRRNW